jgi:hypothetical protein
LDPWAVQQQLTYILFAVMVPMEPR